VNVLDRDDLPWIGELVDIVARAEGQPWRVAEAELERVAAPPKQLAAVTGALRKLVGGRAAHTRVAREVRAIVLGAPALDAHARSARLEAAASTLGIPQHELEPLLWSDLPRERAIELPNGRPDELDVIAHANVQLVQRALGRAYGVHVRLWGDDGGVLRGALARGLIVTATRERDHAALSLVGPLALCHRTGVYGRALGQLAPLLAGCDRFEVAIDAGDYAIALASPIVLPAVPAIDRAVGYAARKLARELAKLDRALAIDVLPAPLEAGRTLVCPDMIVRRGAAPPAGVDGVCVELVGFWTESYLDKKLARYRDADASVVLVVDHTRGDEPLAGSTAEHVVGYTRRVNAAAVAAAISNVRSRSCRSPSA
jgi:predicted nuclease of restriction endonuclease-like RecB superfamily